MFNPKPKPSVEVTCEEASTTVRRVLTEVKVPTSPWTEIEPLLRRLSDADALARAHGVEQPLLDQLKERRTALEDLRRIEIENYQFDHPPTL